MEQDARRYNNNINRLERRCVFSSECSDALAPVWAWRLGAGVRQY